MITSESPSVNEGFSNYSVQGSSLVALNGALLGNGEYTAKGGNFRGAGGTGGRTLVAGVTVRYKWDGDGDIGPPYTFRFIPTFSGSVSSSANGIGEYSADINMTGSSGGTPRPPSPNSPQDDWASGDLNYNFHSRGDIHGPTGNFATATSDIKSYPSIGVSGFTMTANFTATGSVKAINAGSTSSLDEIVVLDHEITIDH